MMANKFGGPAIMDCPRCGKRISLVLGEYDFKVYNIDSEILHPCYAKECQ
jgi:hypothetical protein